MTHQFEIQLIASLVAVACALPGVFLVLRRMAMMSDAISHSILLGIVVGFFIVHDINHPLLILGAAASGVLTVFLVEALLRTNLVKEDAAIGLIFPILFSIGVLLISRFAGNVHLDIDAVLLGELALAPLNRGEFLGLNLPMGVWVMGTIFLLNSATILLFYKELKLATFDANLAAALGFSPALIHYGLMSLVSVTAVGAFDHVGVILVVALMIAPAATAYLLTDSLSRMLAISAFIGVLSAISGYWLNRLIDSNIASAMATMTGVYFLAALILAPERGLVARAWQRSRRRKRFAVDMLLVHLSRHEATPHESTENSLAHLTGEMNWDHKVAEETIHRAQRQGLLNHQNGLLQLTTDGRETAQAVLER